MNEYNYALCGLRICLQAERAVEEDGQSTPFRAEPDRPADLIIRVAPVEEIGTPEPLASRVRLTLRQGDTVTRITRIVFRDLPHIRTRYRLSAPGQVEVQIRADCWEWGARSQFFWTGAALHQLLLPFRTLVFHAACIAHAGGGILFTAPSGTGKSTQAELWRVHRGAEVVNGDKAGVTLREAPMAHGMPFSGTSGICRNRSLPLRAVVVLRQAPENTVTRLAPSQAVQTLCTNVFVDRTVPEEWSMALNLLLDLAAAVPVYELACTPDVRAVEALERAMKEDDKR